MSAPARHDNALALAEPVPEPWRGELELTVRRRGTRSVAARQFHRGALRVLRPMYLDATGQVTYVVVNPGGAYLDGDRYRMDVAVHDGGDLLLTTQSATKIYRTPHAPAVHQCTVLLDKDSRLEYLPDPLIAYRNARYRQHTRIEMDPSATLVISEVITPGWSPTGEPFRYGEVRLRTSVTMGGYPVVLDNLVLNPARDRESMAGLGYLEGHTHVGTVLVLGPRTDEAALETARRHLADRADHLQGGVSALPVPGFALRVLGTSTQAVDELIRTVVGDLRTRWFGHPTLNLRKY